ncbi:uncharacterized protein G2W53_029527 [Senna tora]|uniref:Uncharacterized protein n=1 Tax=Senna tora TaxID=362788 RepID=A0A834T3A7_9FABA|nr:uncharacterized protein G2W53_029527 [Senna tora]
MFLGKVFLIDIRYLVQLILDDCLLLQYELLGSVKFYGVSDVLIAITVIDPGGFICCVSSHYNYKLKLITMALESAFSMEGSPLVWEKVGLGHLECRKKFFTAITCFSKGYSEEVEGTKLEHLSHLQENSGGDNNDISTWFDHSVEEWWEDDGVKREEDGVKKREDDQSHLEDNEEDCDVEYIRNPQRRPKKGKKLKLLDL